jgi:hypothetical protein
MKEGRKERKSSVFCNIIPCSPLKVNWRFGGTNRLHLEGQGVSQPRNRHEAKLYVSPKHWLTYTELHTVTLLKTESFIAAVVRTSSTTRNKFVFPRRSLHTR